MGMSGLAWLLVPTLLMLSGVPLCAWMAYWVARNLRLAIQRRRPWPLIVAWTAALVPPTAMAVGMAYVVWLSVARLLQGYGGHA